MRLTLLGTGNAAQVPVYNCQCVACGRARHTPGFRRGPCSALLEGDGARWLIDAGLPDLAERYPPGSLDGILLTHYHADHAQGLLPLRWGIGMTLPVLGPPDEEGLADLYKHPGILDFSRKLVPFETLALSGRKQSAAMQLTPLPLLHSRLTYGYAIRQGSRGMAYLTDTVGLPGPTASRLSEHPLDLLVLDCTHPPAADMPRNHNDLTRALDIVSMLRPGKAVLTHIGHKLDAFLMEHPGHLPPGVVIGRDGDVFDLGGR
ncbi:phosphonate metabolism protein PhnP [Pollutimonas thiosulfatoxidans]|uniref:Phosphonate metabolism protein PhnP n=1 Tax=Pollutimonas thiosulfatoxidans TaxID=2028345 RepID=A0A410GFK6_9BURK|nr:phosphonate metabolism protein PhnP [Pollutimonas thiosulfatoxidans]MBF6615788.1 phosphonate metabolism protein PhnP [Candidimonas sp.]QAA95083.1 phosphonate metabolism protein PhnP [Pollutimonas thiosulfatoxidans]